ncbi:hypothetical protein KC343_g11491 [Hortaea werneckii]|uniref:Myb-like domain-containing protein n=1 Tax=Hortaea werneckii TaxID=91943 RepID=A0A3M7F6E7_HORWE|nr:hypothetical protein KC352_g14761 [Hortaea werneckii]KAI7563798.1 hypothetical protein KC317_g7487 [Hortaea werneckii]KAI7611659.1 hypothetical protein KC343_g11491 [Hortaea werneckii]KAI7614089.1 hypothetical protein KC346_g7079 [Hortaea werneckii]KAI7665983.1 hypothetical protein KC319_g7076 [Hortaea werneckii]
MPSSPWNDATDRQLLLAIIHLTVPQTPKWDEVAAIMGNGFTAEAVRQHFQKMRKDSRAQLGEPATTKKGGNSTKNTPRKPKATNGNGETPGKSGKRKEATNGPEEADDDESESPTKKMKAEDDGEEWLA